MNRVRLAVSSPHVSIVALSLGMTSILSLLGCSSDDAAMSGTNSSSSIFTSDASRVVVSDEPDIELGCPSNKSIYTFDVRAGTLAYTACVGSGPLAGTMPTGSFALSQSERASVVAKLQAVTVFAPSSMECVPDGETLTADVTTTDGVLHYVDEMSACSTTSGNASPGYEPTTGLDAVSSFLGQLVREKLMAGADAGS